MHSSTNSPRINEFRFPISCRNSRKRNGEWCTHIHSVRCVYTIHTYVRILRVRYSFWLYSFNGDTLSASPTPFKYRILAFARDSKEDKHTRWKKKETARKFCANYGHEQWRKRMWFLLLGAWMKGTVCACGTVVFFVSWVLGRWTSTLVLLLHIVSIVSVRIRSNPLLIQSIIWQRHMGTAYVRNNIEFKFKILFIYVIDDDCHDGVCK